MMRARVAALAVALVVAGAAAWTVRSTTPHTLPDARVTLSPDPGQADGTAPVAPVGAASKPAMPPPITTDTPVAERVAVLGVLNKRNGVSRDITLHPGQAARVGNIVIRLRACETTADWETEQLTGAFVQAFARGRGDGWRRIFSGWLYKESPSLNVVEDPLYDVWPKSCAMRHPETGPDTVSVSSAAPRRSIAKKSAEPPVADAEPSPSASSNNAT